MELNITDIEIGIRKRRLDESKVRALADSFSSIGQLQPVTVSRQNDKYYLIAGLHRLEAARLLGWQAIQAVEFEGDAVTVELAEIDENLMRNDLTVLEQGEHLARRQELIGFKRGGDRRSEEFQSETVSLRKNQEDIAREIGLTERAAQQRMQAARNIVPEVKDAIRDTEIANSITQLLELARMEPEKQIEVGRQIAGGAKCIADASRKIRSEEIQAERSAIAEVGAATPKDNRWNIYTGDIRTWSAPRQYDFIITDPPYPKEYLNSYETLAIKACEWLKPGGLLIAMCGQSYLDQIYAMMSKHLVYYWTACYLTPGQPTPLRTRQVNTTWKPLLIYSVDGNYKGKIFGDVFKSDGNDKEFHKWGQSVSGMTAIIKQICLPGQYILDPFCGAGTTGIAALSHGCLFDGLDIDEGNANLSRGRLHDATAAG